MIYFTNSILFTFILFSVFFDVDGRQRMLFLVSFPHFVSTVFFVRCPSDVTGLFSPLLVCIDIADIWSPASGIKDRKNDFLFSFTNYYLVF